MNALTQEQMARLKAMLEQRRLALEGLGGEPVAAGDLPVDEVETSPADKATVRLLNDLALEAAGHSAAALQTIRRALAKFDNDAYGACEQCGNDIGYSRLEARPEAQLCISCQTRAEKH